MRKTQWSPYLRTGWKAAGTAYGRGLWLRSSAVGVTTCHLNVRDRRGSKKSGCGALRVRSRPLQGPSWKRAALTGRGGLLADVVAVVIRGS